jgi:hypothetical protein
MQSIRLPFNWIDILVVPIATSIMEAQPFAIVLLFFSLLLSGKSATVPLNSVSIILLMLGFHWWAQLTEHLKGRSKGKIWAEIVWVFCLLLAFTLIIFTHLALLNNLFFFLCVIALILWFWVRGRRRAQNEFSESQLLFSFKLCFTVLLVVLLITILLNHDIAATLFAAIAIALPLFFLSGLVAISFIRLSATRHETGQASSCIRFDHSHRWSLFLLLAWSLLVAVVLLVESFAFQPLLALLTPLIHFILQFFRLKPPVSHVPVKPTPTPVHPQTNHPLPPEHLTLNPLIQLAIFVILGMIVVAGIILVLVAIVLVADKRREERYANSVEERETLDVRSTLNDRRKRNQERKTKFQLETLAPNSIRARYRELLVATARQEHLQRRPYETPAEYERRLRQVVASLPNKEDEPTNTAILTELTKAYTLERYGRRQISQAQEGYFKRWVQRLVKRIKGKTKRSSR